MQFPEAMAIDPSGRAAFVACMGSMTLTSLLIDDATGALTPTGTVITTWNSPRAIAFGPTGRHIYVIHQSVPGTLSYYRVDPASGSIELVDALPLGRFPAALVISRLSR
jgi:6-phosphogluconolactonase